LPEVGTFRLKFRSVAKRLQGRFAELLRLLELPVGRRMAIFALAVSGLDAD
jgi:hypothetical protein